MNYGYLMTFGTAHCPLLRAGLFCAVMMPVSSAASCIGRRVVSAPAYRRSQKLHVPSPAAFASTRASMISSPLTAENYQVSTRINLSVAAHSEKKEVESSSASSPAEHGQDVSSPWAQTKKRDGRNKARFRQHVNPLARRFQMETELPKDWPRCRFDDPSLPLHLDIGCGKGGFLLELAKMRQRHRQEDADGGTGTTSRNYLGLEIRPNVARHAQERVERWNLTGGVDFVGCNANVDLRRLLNLYQSSGDGKIDFVSIQFPDPHFKAAHAKRRVVTPELVMALADFLSEGKEVFIQSDVKDVFDDMRERFRDQASLFEDTVQDFGKFLPENPIGTPTEREISVLDQDLPVYRTIFKRTANDVEEY